MTSIIKADDGVVSGVTGITSTADNSGTLEFQAISQLITMANVTGAQILPSGTTAQRPSSPVAGMVRFNTTLGNPEWYSSVVSGWVPFSDTASYSIEMFAWGGGGTQSAGGTSVSGTGSALQGGSSGTEGDSGGSGGGGGGYYGGGAGSNTNPGSAGGGGSGYYNSTYVASATLTAGSGTTPGDSSNALRGSYGNGGASGANAGTQGVFIIRYLGAQRGTGGTVTSSGGYTYHTFTTAGTFTA